MGERVLVRVSRIVVHGHHLADFKLVCFGAFLPAVSPTVHRKSVPVLIVILGFVRSDNRMGDFLSRRYCPVYSPFVDAEDDEERPWERYQQVPPRWANPTAELRLRLGKTIGEIIDRR